MSVEDLREQHRAAEAYVHNLKERLRERRDRLIDIDVAAYARNNGRTTIKFSPGDFICCRTLQGHTGKVYSLDWSRERNFIVSASQDGRLIVWNALTSQKYHAVKLPCAWVMTCAFSPGGHAVACGGLDSICSIYALSSQQERDGNLPISKTLIGHKGYISCCQYAPDREASLITSSGDGTCALWDSETCQRVAAFGGDSSSGRNADVTSVSINAANSHIFVSGSIDMTARLWDMRIASKSACVFYGHDGDVNTVKFFPDGLRIGTGSDDGTCRIFDTRTGHQLQVYMDPQDENQTASVTSIAFSYSGRLLFAAYSTGACYIWDTETAQTALDLGRQNGAHTKRVSCLGLAPDGSALCTGSWDQNLKIWAFDGQRKIV